MNRRVAAGFAVSVVLLFGTACGGSDSDPAESVEADGIRVAGFNFAESEMLVELYAQAIESTGVPVIRLGPVGPREIVIPALELDRIDLVPEYLGSALAFWGAPESNPDAESARSELNELLEPRGLTTLSSSAAQDRNVFVVTADTAEAEGLDRISDLIGPAATMRFGGPPECVDRPLCLAGLEAVYGLSFGEFVPQRTVAFTAEALERGEIDVGLLFSTSPELADPRLFELEDDRGLQPAENIIPVIRPGVLDRWGPEVEEVIDLVSLELTTIDLRLLNARLSQGEAVTELAREWLAENLLLNAD